MMTLFSGKISLVKYLLLLLLLLSLFLHCIIQCQRCHVKEMLKYYARFFYVQGMRDCEREKKHFSFLKDQKASFYFLQETYSDTNDESFWKSERRLCKNGLH